MLDAEHLEVPEILLRYLVMLFLLRAVLSMHVNLDQQKGVVLFCVTCNYAAYGKCLAKILRCFGQEFEEDSLEFYFV